MLVFVAGGLQISPNRRIANPTEQTNPTEQKNGFFPSLQDDVRVRLESDLVRLSSETSLTQVLKITEQTRTNYGFGTAKIALCHISHY